MELAYENKSAKLDISNAETSSTASSEETKVPDFIENLK